MQIKHFIRLYSVSNSDIRAAKIHVFLTIGGQYSNSLLDHESIERYRTPIMENPFCSIQSVKRHLFGLIGGTQISPLHVTN